MTLNDFFQKKRINNICTIDSEVVNTKYMPKSDSNNIRLKRNLQTLTYISFIENNCQIIEDKEQLKDILMVKENVQKRIINISNRLSSSNLKSA